MYPHVADRAITGAAPSTVSTDVVDYHKAEVCVGWFGEMLGD